MKLDGRPWLQLRQAACSVASRYPNLVATYRAYVAAEALAWASNV